MMVFEVIEADEGRDVHCDTSQDQDCLKVSVPQFAFCTLNTACFAGLDMCKEMYRSNPFRSTLSGQVLTYVSMIGSSPFRVTLQVWACVKYIPYTFRSGRRRGL